MPNLYRLDNNVPDAQRAGGRGWFIFVRTGHTGQTGTAGVANPTNTFTADAAWTNPAGMTGLEHDEVLTGLQFVVPWVEFDPSVAEAGGSDGGNAGIFTVAPSLFVVKKLSERARLGFSVAGLLGGGVDYGSDFVGRFSVIKANLAGVGLSPSIAYKINDRLSIGALMAACYQRVCACRPHCSAAD